MRERKRGRLKIRSSRDAALDELSAAHKGAPSPEQLTKHLGVHVSPEYVVGNKCLNPGSLPVRLGRDDNDLAAIEKPG